MKSTIKFFVLIGLSVACAWALTPLLEKPGSLRLEWLGYVVESTAFAFVALLFIMLLLLQMLVLGVVWLFNLPSRHMRRRAHRKHDMAMENLTRLLSTSPTTHPTLHAKYLRRAKRQLSKYPELLQTLKSFE